MPYLRQRSLTGIPASASFKIATIWLSVMRLLIVKLLCFSLKEILRVGCIILRGSYTNFPEICFVGNMRGMRTDHKLHWPHISIIELLLELTDYFLELPNKNFLHLRM